MFNEALTFVLREWEAAGRQPFRESELTKSLTAEYQRHQLSWWKWVWQLIYALCFLELGLLRELWKRWRHRHSGLQNPEGWYKLQEDLSRLSQEGDLWYWVDIKTGDCWISPSPQLSEKMGFGCGITTSAEVSRLPRFQFSLQR